MHTANGQAAALIGGMRWIGPWLSVLLVSGGIAYATNAAVLRCCSSDTRVDSGSGSTLMTELSPAETRLYGVSASGGGDPTTEGAARVRSPSWSFGSSTRVARGDASP